MRININKQKKLALFTLFLLLGIFLIVLVIAYPILDSGIKDYFDEDQSPTYTYNFTQNVTGSITGDLVFSIEAINSSAHSFGSVSDYGWITINTSSGIMTFDSTKDNETGNFTISVHVLDSSEQGTTVASNFFVNATNDAPNFTNIESEYNLTQELEFSEYVNATDELSESHYPLIFNVTWLSNCSHASWSNRDNCTLLSFLNSTNVSGLMNFTAVKNDVGTYYANISVTDSGENYTCTSGYCDSSYSQNQTTYYSQIINFNVFSYLDINVSDCQNLVFQENSSNTCEINITTREESNLLNISSNASLRNFQASVFNSSWFYIFNQTYSSNYTLTLYINATPGRTEVGNWTVNFSAIDITSNETDSELIYVYVNRTYNSVPDLVDIENTNTSIDYLTRINITVYDDDFLIPDKNTSSGGYNETINFTVVVLNQSDLTQELTIDGFDLEIIDMPISGTNTTDAKIEFMSNESEVGDYTINITVRDEAGVKDMDLFNLTIFNNLPPEWVEPLQTIFIIYEDNNTYLNLSQNITDDNNVTITFSYTNDTDFSSFSLTSSGIINFTSVDEDVGQHLVSVTISDGYVTNTTIFNFTVYNLNDTVYIEKPIQQTSIINAAIDENSNINCTEDNMTTIYLWIQDDDFKIPSGQKSFYDENLTVNLTIEGNNLNLFQFIENTAFPPASYTGENRSQYYAIFTPNKSDIGSYNITINVSDNSDLIDTLSFNLTVLEINHDPVLMDLENQSLAVNESFYYRINATDIEDGSSDAFVHNLTFSYNFLYGDDFINNDESIFNTTSGELNTSFNSSGTGKYHINITVNDSNGNEDFGSFWINVYGFPVINYPLSSAIYSLTENITSNLIFRLNHSVGDNLTYLFYIEDKNISSLRYNISYYGNNTNLTWEFTPNLTDETSNANLILVAYPSAPNFINKTSWNITQRWNLTIAHVNDELEFLGLIGGADQRISGVSSQSITLSDYFQDNDAADSKYNQTIGFTYTLLNSSSGTITVTMTNWTNGSVPSIVFSASSYSLANYSVTGYEYNESNSLQIIRNVTSNNFTIELNVSSGEEDGGTVEVIRSGGSSVTYVPIAFKLITPDEVKCNINQKIIIPLKLSNTGNFLFKNITLFASVFQEGEVYDDVQISLDRKHFDSLSRDKTENLTLTLYFLGNKTGTYRIIINASSQTPVYHDWAEIYIDLQKMNSSDLEKLLLFVEEFIVENPECIEIREVVDEAKNDYDKGDYVNAELKLEQAISACKDSITQVRLPVYKPSIPFGIEEYMIIISAFALFFGLFYYFIKRRRFHKKLVKEKKQVPKRNSFYRE